LERLATREQQPPIMNVSPPAVHVEAAKPPDVHVHVEQPKPRAIRVEEDPVTGETRYVPEDIEEGSG
jgi:hypothetical protein